MKTPPLVRLITILLLAASSGGAVERVEIVLDASAGMWLRPAGGPPLFVAVRDTLQDYAAASVLRQGRPEVAVRIVGGGTSLGSDDWCNDTRLVAAFGLFAPQGCREALDDVVPRGGRPLVQGLKEAVSDLADAQDRRRIVVITSGSDQCHEDIIDTITNITTAEPPIEVRIIGLGLEKALADAATQLAPTRNLTEIASLRDAVEWALEPPDTRPAVASRIEIQLSLGDSPLVSPAIELADATGGARAFSAVDDGQARVRLTPGRYRARIEMNELPAIEISGLEVGGPDQQIELHLSDAPPVTLEAIPEQPLAGGLVHIGFWGAPPGSTWVLLALPDSAVGSYLTRSRTGEGRGAVTLEVPDSATELEARLVFEPQPGVAQLLGRVRFKTEDPKARLECVEEIENGQPLEVSWGGPGHEGDHITITARGAEDTDHAVCLPVAGESGVLNTFAPAVVGDYSVSYLSSRGTVLDRRSLEVFEVLATLDTGASAPPATDLVIAWTGPDAPQDFLSIAHPDSPGDEYLSWIPTSDGNPAHLRVPRDSGLYEVRYIRSTDEEILARHNLEVVAAEVELQVPNSVAAGTRFKVRWTGTARSGDFLAVAEIGSGVQDSLDFSFASGGSPSSLAAPFEPGNYEVRYVSGSGLEIVKTVPLVVD